MAISKDISQTEDAPTQEAKSETRLADADSGSGAVQQVIVRQGPGWQTMALLFLTMLLFTTVAVAFYAFHRVGILNDEMGDTMRRVEQKIFFRGLVRLRLARRLELHENPSTL